MTDAKRAVAELEAAGWATYGAAAGGAHNDPATITVMVRIH